MKTNTHIAKHFKEIYFGGNWTCSHLKNQLSDVTWQEATQQVNNLNTIATLAFHIHYYVLAVTKVLQGKPLEAKDEQSFNHSLQTEKDWITFLDHMWKEAEEFIQCIEQLPDEKLNAYFTDKKYGLYYRNLHGIIEHSHYHLGQIAIIKKIIRA